MMEAYKYHALPQRRFNLQTMRTQPRKSTVGKLYLVGGMDANKGNGGGNSQWQKESILDTEENW